MLGLVLIMVIGIILLFLLNICVIFSLVLRMFFCVIVLFNFLLDVDVDVGWKVDVYECVNGFWCGIDDVD